MDKVKLAVIYYSQTGSNYQLAQWAKVGGEEAGAEVRVLRVEDIANEEMINSNKYWKANYDNTKDIPVATNEDLVWADAIIFSAPTRYGNVAAEMKYFLDGTVGPWSEGKLVDKIVSAMSSSANVNGGQESTVKAIYSTMMHWGSIIVPVGYTDKSVYVAGGNPYGTTATIKNGTIEEDLEETVKHQAKRVVNTAKAFLKGRE